MGRTEKTLRSYKEGGGNKPISRRSFIKGTMALGASAAIYGCSKDGADDTFIFPTGSNGVVEVEPSKPENAKYVYGSSSHNCGGRCSTRAEVINGKIKRILSDESLFSYTGQFMSGESRNYPQTKACARCRAYRYRLYHSGRLKYPLKQTKKRGDLSGFKRISWQQALSEIASKHKQVLNKYGTDGIYAIYACGHDTSPYQSASSGPIARKKSINGSTAYGNALRLMGNAQTMYFSNYSVHQWQFLGFGYSGAWPVGALDIPANNVAKYTTDIVLWGNNSLSTRNPKAYASVRAVEDMKARNASSKVIFIGPEFTDTGVTCADEWVVSKPYTDGALIAGMVYHMLDNTFDLKTGKLKKDPWLDIDYLDTVVYGFFDSPAYKLNETTGEISKQSGDASSGERNINSVLKGKSYCSWVLGNSSVAMSYSETKSNYTATQYAVIDSSFKRWAPVSYNVKKETANQTNVKSSLYKTKQDYLTPKTPAWASKITNIPEDTIKDLAKLFCKKGAQILSLWSGGLQKQMNGVPTLYAIQMLHIITKNVYKQGAGIEWYISPSFKAGKGLTIQIEEEDFAGTQDVEKPLASCTAWHNAIKLAYGDVLKKNGYKAEYIPDWKESDIGTGKVYFDDGGAKAMLSWQRNGSGKVEVDDVTGYFKYKEENGKPLYAGIRLMYNTGGNIFINQHQNSNDSRQMLECLPLSSNDADSFCLVSFDNFLSPTPQYSDYVLPAATNWEQQDIISPTNSTPFYAQIASYPQGEAKSTWDFAEALLEAYQTGLSTKLTGSKPLEYHVKKAFLKASADTSSPFYNKTWEEYLENPYIPAEEDNYSTAPASMISTFSMSNYDSAVKTNPFIKKTQGYYASVDEVGAKPISTEGYGYEFLEANLKKAPKSPLRFSVYSDILVWNYEHRFEKWHGYLKDSGKTGQANKDLYEQDPMVLPIPMYFAYEDYFMEAYNKQLPPENNRFLLTTTHDRYRSHSSMAENPLLRELTHKVVGKRNNTNNPAYPYTRNQDTLKPANDYEFYANGPKNAFTVGGTGTYPYINQTIGSQGIVADEFKDIASYSEIWINDEDAKEQNIANGDLIDVWNKIGAVRCVARVSKRCAKGFLGLHQGCWYDIRAVSNSVTGHKFIDVGGNCNTLMASMPSRIDHGNGQQSAMVQIAKVIY